eukprot:TRINITY_DN33294_c0_g1_i1.p1 TRINITY_DN33294_c0_g1~~TRINITY_DN33294_c0_g1_i1.p1  ORF type:complete len:197 (+),score=28.75 TRINITY_DN33294_c0_g1_i1:593-1183(+)
MTPQSSPLRNQSRRPSAKFSSKCLVPPSFLSLLTMTLFLLLVEGAPLRAAAPSPRTTPSPPPPTPLLTTSPPPPTAVAPSPGPEPPSQSTYGPAPSPYGSYDPHHGHTDGDMNGEGPRGADGPSASVWDDGVTFLKRSHGGLGGLAIAGVVIGIVGLLFLGCFLCLCFPRHRNSTQGKRAITGYVDAWNRKFTVLK